MAKAVADHPVQVDINRLSGSKVPPAPPAVIAADSLQLEEQLKLRKDLLNFAKELGEPKEKRVADLRSEADQTTNALLQISGIYFAFVGLLLSIVAGGSNIRCKHLWSPIALCTLGSIGFWIAFGYLVYVFYDKEIHRKDLQTEIDEIEEDKDKISGNSIVSLVRREIREEAIKPGLLVTLAPRNRFEEVDRKLQGKEEPVQEKSGKRKPASKKQRLNDWSTQVNKLDNRTKGLFFFVFFLGGLALTATYFTVIFSIVHILCH